MERVTDWVGAERKGMKLAKGENLNAAFVRNDRFYGYN